MVKNQWLSLPKSWLKAFKKSNLTFEQANLQIVMAAVYTDHKYSLTNSWGEHLTLKSIAKLAKKAGVKAKKTVRKYLKTLVKTGHLAYDGERYALANPEEAAAHGFFPIPLNTGIDNPHALLIFAAIQERKKPLCTGHWIAEHIGCCDETACSALHQLHESGHIEKLIRTPKGFMVILSGAVKNIGRPLKKLRRAASAKLKQPDPTAAEELPGLVWDCFKKCYVQW